MGLKKLFFTPVLERARWEAWKFQRSCQRVEETQQRVLGEKIALNGSSAMGRSLGIPSAGSIEAFRSRIPVTTYEDYSAAVEKCKSGDASAMLGPGQKIVMFALSSGTTGQSKFIPITPKFLQEYRRGWLAWGFYAYQGNAVLVETKLLPITSSSCEFKTSAGIPCGAISGLTIDNLSWITRHLYALPKEVYQIKNPETKYYVLGRLALEQNVGSISSANPSTVLSVFRLINERRNEIIQDIRKGTLSGAQNLPEQELRNFQARLRPNPARAAALEDMAARHGGLYPKHFWKDFTLISNWKGGSLERYLDFYPEFFGNTQVRDIGLVASEGRMTIPMSGDGSEGALDVMAHFFEFIPEDAIEDKTPRTFLAHELEQGKRYFILLTTSSGLYRYDIRDLVEVTGHYGQAPVLKFLNKGKHFSSITGEKLSEHQVVGAVGQAARRFGIALEDYCVFPKWGKIPRYGLLVDEDKVGPQAVWGPFLRELDAALRRLNCEYDSKRESGRLGSVSLYFVPPKAFEAHKKRKLEAQGGRVEQYKHVFLVPDDALDKQFQVIREFSVSDLADTRVS